MLNRSLDLKALRRKFGEDGRIRIDNALDPAIAGAVADELAKLSYQLFCATGEGVAVIHPAEMAAWDRVRQVELQTKRFLQGYLGPAREEELEREAA